MPLTPEQQAEIDKALEKEKQEEIDEINDIDIIDPVDPVDPVIPPTDADVPAKSDSENPPADPPASDDPSDKPIGEDIPPADDKPVEDPPKVDDVAELRKIINNQNAEILALKSSIVPKPKVEKEEPPKAEPPADAPPKVEKPAEYQPVDYVGDLDMDDVTADKNVLNGIINKAVQDAIKISQTYVPDVEPILTSIPTTVQEQISQQLYIDRLVNEFYSANNDLKPVKETVSQVAQNIAAEHPEYDQVKLFNEAAKLTRSLLRMPEPVEEEKPSEEKSEFDKPGFVGKTSMRQRPAQSNALVDEIAELDF